MKEGSEGESCTEGEVAGQTLQLRCFPLPAFLKLVRSGQKYVICYSGHYSRANFVLYFTHSWMYEENCDSILATIHETANLSCDALVSLPYPDANC